MRKPYVSLRGCDVGAVAPPSLRSYDHKCHSLATASPVSEESLVQQQFANEVDINTIMRRYGVTGEMPFGSAVGVYGDFTGVYDYESALERVRGAQERFMSLPAEVRERFNNDPGVLIAAAQSMPVDQFVGMFEPTVRPAEEGSGELPPTEGSPSS